MRSEHIFSYIVTEQVNFESDNDDVSFVQDRITRLIHKSLL